ncbi:MAG: amidohydrolase family protein [Hyphomicrobiaceae bacterium]
MNAALRHADLLVLGKIVTMDARQRIIADGAVAITGRDIAAVGARDEVLRDWQAPRRIGGDAIVIPGMIDAHTHCTQCFVRALTSNELPMIPRIYNPAQQSLSPAQAGAAVRLLAAQLIRAGVTTLCEGTLNPAHEDAIVDALQEAGVRCVMARGAADQDFHHAALYAQRSGIERSWVKERQGEAERDLMRSAAFLDRFPARGPGLIRGAVNASALPGFSASYFRGAGALARGRQATLHTHVSRDREEVELSMAVWGKRPVERLAELDVLDERFVAVHAVLASPREIRMLGEARASLVHSPIECVANLNAVADVQQFRSAGCRVALGCDIQANDMFATMRAGWLVHGALYGITRYDPEYLTAAELFAMVTTESARVLRIDDRTGSIEAGKAADIVVLDANAPHLMAQQDVVSELVRYGSRAEVQHVLIDGQVVLENGQHRTIDLDRLKAEASAGARHVRNAVVERRYKPL